MGRFAGTSRTSRSGSFRASRTSRTTSRCQRRYHARPVTGSASDIPGRLPASFWALWSGLLVNRAATFVVAVLGLFEAEGLESGGYFTGVASG